MSKATSFEYALDRIYELLVDGAGSQHTLGSSDQFATGIYPTQDDGQRAYVTRGSANNKTVWVGLTDDQPYGYSPVGDKNAYWYSIQIICAYAVESEGEHDKWRSIISTAANDTNRIRSVLEHPDNWPTTTNGDDTGIGALEYQGGETNGPDAETRLLTRTLNYNLYVTLSK